MYLMNTQSTCCDTEKALIPTEIHRYIKQSSAYINPENPNQTNIDEKTYELQEIIQEKCDLTCSIDIQEMEITENRFLINSDNSNYQETKEIFELDVQKIEGTNKNKKFMYEGTSMYQETKAICESMHNIDVQALEVPLENQELIEGDDNPVYHKKNRKRLASKSIGISLPITKQTKISDEQVINILGDKSILKEHNNNSKASSFIKCMVIDNQHKSINKDSLEKDANDQVAQIKIVNNSSNVTWKDNGDEVQPMCQNQKININNKYPVYKNMYQNKKIKSNDTNLIVKDFINNKNEQVINLNIFLSSSKQPNEREQNGTEKQIIVETFHANSTKSKLSNTAESLFRGKSNFVCKCICALQAVKEQQLNSEVIHQSNINGKINKEYAYTGSISTLNLATNCDTELDKNSKQKKLIISPNISHSTQTLVNINSKNEIINKSGSNSNEDVYENNETEKLNKMFGKIFEQTDVILKSNNEIINRPNNSYYEQKVDKNSDTEETIVILNSNETTTNNVHLKSSDQKFHQPATTNTKQISNFMASATVVESKSSYNQVDGDLSNHTNIDVKSATAYNVKGEDQTDEICTFSNNILPKSLTTLEHLNMSSPAFSEKNKKYKVYIMPIKGKVTENSVLENLFIPNPSTPVDVNIKSSDFKYIKRIYFDQPFIDTTSDTTNNLYVEKNDNQVTRLDDKQPLHLHQNSIQNESLLSVVCNVPKNVRKTENLSNKNQEMIDIQLARQLHTELNRQEFKRSSLKKL